ncbi:DUF6508 domain-containing protein [Rothia nasimurium]|uniref:DUF6508 domain-containing protein n=1 Tax=Rothia nasimurium TaxID=85336 RepID=UPI001F1CD2C4|nr:DUF6508 domain-containing protein [Rothia nasimurium]
MGIRDKKTAEQLFDGITLMHRNLKDGVETNPAEDSPARLGYSEVPPWLWNGISDAMTFLSDVMGVGSEPYSNWLKNHQDPAPIEECDLADLTLYFYMAGRGERFSEGTIAGFVKTGKLLAMTERFFELVPTLPETDLRQK